MLRYDGLSVLVAVDGSPRHLCVCITVDYFLVKMASVVVVKITLQLIQLIIVAGGLRLPVAELDQRLAILVVIAGEVLQLAGELLLATGRLEILLLLMWVSRVASRQAAILRLVLCAAAGE